MSTPSEKVNNDLDSAKKPLPDDALPPVTPPTAGFIFQLFLIPLIIVSIVVMVWLMFSWLAHMGSDPESLAKGLDKGDDAAWQSASTLAHMLREPQKKHLRYDKALAERISTALEKQLDEEGKNKNEIRLRIFLCRALGEFQILDVLPTLTRAATEERFPEEIVVRRTALEAFTVLANNIGPEKLRDNEELMKIILAAAVERRPSEPKEQAAERAMLRERAVFALGVIGGPEALDRLVSAMDDPNANVRFNAANGLARYGDERAIPTLLETLDPDNPDTVEGAEYESGKDWKRVLVINNAIGAAEKLLTVNPAADRREIVKALESLQTSEMKSIRSSSVKKGIRQKAKGALLRIESLEPIKAIN